MSFRTKKELRSHAESHIRNGFVILCPFLNADLTECTNKFTKVPTFRTHFSQYHKEEEVGSSSTSKNYSLTEDGSIAFADDDDDDFSPNMNDDSEDECNEEHETFFDCDFSEPKSDEIYPENFVRDHVGKFYLWMEGVLLIPTVKVQAICEEITSLLEMSHHRIKSSMKIQLMQTGIQEDKAEQIIELGLKKDVVYAAHHKGMDSVDVTSDYMRKKFYKHRCSFVDFEEINLGQNDAGKQRFAHRIPVRDTLETMFTDRSVQKDIDDSFKRTSTPGIYRDIYDGSVLQEHALSSNMDCIELILFQDAFEFYPLSPVAGIYKCLGFYFMLGNINPNHRSKVDAIQLAFLVRETDIKYFGADNVLRSLLDELKDLANNGIKYKGKTLPVVVTHMCGDNLGQHYIGGFLESFSSVEYPCRFCEVTKKMLEKNPSCVLPFRTPKDYKNAIEQLDPGNPLSSKKGLKRESVLNDIPFFHVCQPGLPPCIGHDILEGVGRSDYALYLRYFIEVKEWFTFETLNKRIQNFKPHGRDAADSLVKLDPALKKIRGHASEVWLFIRMLPFLISDQIEDKDDRVWQLCLQLKTICEYAFSPVISELQLVKLKELTSLYLETRAKLFKKKLSPQHHYMNHYAELVPYFGPLIRLWTLRFESRHVFFKSAAQAANNFRNITKTLIKKYALNFAFRFSGNLIAPSINFREKDASNIPSLDELKQEVIQFVKSDTSYQQILTSVEIHGMTYSPGMWTMLGSNGRDLVVGEIVLILFNGSEVKFILKKHCAINTFQGYYEIQDEANDFTAAHVKDLTDYYPLSAYEYEGRLCLSLKHSNPSMDQY
ncbi:Hyaluronidase [Frankliniella fusca]|uniref:Hyaluronidase n=1 Tax=Frankliniella fusca TaxID=407009 RepID=A0AAE1H9T3_9NEOP|nr:Hyaluronidase [Frankliniella fusca]